MRNQKEVLDTNALVFELTKWAQIIVINVSAEGS